MARSTSSTLPAASEKQLSGYASAAFLGIGVLSGARVADAQIVTTTDPDQMIIDNGSIYLFAGAGFAANTGPELTLEFGRTSSRYYERVGGVKNLNVLGGASYFAKNFTKGSTIGPAAGTFLGSGNARIGVRIISSSGANSDNGNFHGRTGYLGFKFTDPKNSAVTDYGWAEIAEGANQNTLTLVNAAYDIGGTIIAGQVPEPGSLALLAAGAGCLAAWRLRSSRQRNTVATNETDSAVAS
jgi:hypothetical protein